MRQLQAGIVTGPLGRARMRWQGRLSGGAAVTGTGGAVDGAGPPAMAARDRAEPDEAGRTITARATTSAAPISVTAMRPRLAPSQRPAPPPRPLAESRIYSNPHRHVVRRYGAAVTGRRAEPHFQARLRASTVNVSASSGGSFPRRRRVSLEPGRPVG